MTEIFLRGNVFADELHDCLDVFDGGAGNDAVAEIEDVAGASGGLIEDVVDAAAHELGVREEGDGIEIALDRAGVVEAAPGLSSGVRQSRPRTSAPVSRMAGRRLAVSTPK